MKSTLLKTIAVVGLMSASAVALAANSCCSDLACCLQMLACCF